MSTPQVNTATGLCTGEEMGSDANGSLVTRSPRTKTWPGTQAQLLTANGLMIDSALGLWTPQQAMFPLRQNYSDAPNTGAAAPGTTYEPTIVESAITNPSTTMSMGFFLNLEWEITANGPMNYVEMWGFYDFPGTGVAPVSRPWEAIASFLPSSQGGVWWHENVSRTVQGVLAPGASCTPQFRWGFRNTTPTGAVATTPDLVYWRVSMIGYGFLVWPVSVG